ncbi:transcription factor bHLH162 isoform X2 [Rutidosis leptorrhynchoides]|uniref:transcription factor bHLH162 isoform X2 n=1 Tax=Rutidosis leptorrhynchoides TaxID=125765 RepID=UPI003A9982E1
MECKPSSSSSSSRVDRRTIEKNRRIQMKALYSKLHSLVPHDPSTTQTISVPDQLQEAANYIKKLQIKLEKMKREKDKLMGTTKLEINHDNDINNLKLGAQHKTPQIDIRESGSSLEAILITGVDFQFLFSETIRVIHEEGFEVVNAGFSILNDTVYHTIHAQIGESCAQTDGVSRIIERLNNIVYGN